MTNISNYIHRKPAIYASACALLLMTTGIAKADDDADAIARSLQDPLANISATITDITFNFGMGGDDKNTGYDFQLQPVHECEAGDGTF